MPLDLCQFDNKLQQLAELLCQSFTEFNSAQINAQIQQYKDDLNHPIGQLAYGLAMSDFVANIAQKTPHLLRQLWLTGVNFADCDNYPQRLSEQLNNVQDESTVYQVLRQFRNQEMVKLSLCQSLNFASVEQIFIHLTKLAESLIIGARDWLYNKACTEMGIPYDEQGNVQKLYILGMGKLGGFELNFSSDIDLIFTYPAQGETRGTRRSIDNGKFFTRLGQRLIDALHQFTADGFVYRTDMRLRPFGDNGPLALSFSAMEQYYQDQGRDWERYAMLKGRILGADPLDPHIPYLQNLLRPFVYRRYIDFSVIQSLRQMKGKIEREVRRRGLKNNIKLGAGGIREVEFIVQVFQLIRGGREISLQQHSLLKILPELQRLNLLSPQQTTDLLNGYLFLRRVENLLQAIDDQQTQTLPTVLLNQARLVEGCKSYYCGNQLVATKINDWSDFYALLQQHQGNIREVFNQLIGDENDDLEQGDQWQDFLETDLCELEQRLQENGIEGQEIHSLIQQLDNFKQSLTHRAVGKRGRDVLTRLMPQLLSRIFAHSDYIQLLPRILKIIEKILTRTTYLELLVENPPVVDRLIELCAKSQFIAEQIAKQPILLDELLNESSLRNPLPFTEYGAELQRYLLRLPPDDEEQYINGLRQFKNSILLHIAAADILGALPIMKVSDHLTYLAEVIVQAVVNLAWSQLSMRFGVPENLPQGEKGFLVIGYGKLGGIELGYKSDLDLVFLYQPIEGQTIGGRKQIDSNQFYLRLAQKVVSIFSMNTSAGVLYEVDMRLRPSGDAGLLGCSLPAFEHYQRNEAWTWEKQALVRSRAIFGESSLRQRFEQIRQLVLSSTQDQQQLKQEVQAMREKMYHNLASKNQQQFNIKTDLGGITDIEFIAQYLVLAHSAQNPKLCKWSDNVRIFEIMAEYGIISNQDSEKLKQCYVDLRNQIHRLNLLGLPPILSTEDFQTERTFIRQFWQKLFG